MPVKGFVVGGGRTEALLQGRLYQALQCVNSHAIGDDAEPPSADFDQRAQVFCMTRAKIKSADTTLTTHTTLTTLTTREHI